MVVIDSLAEQLNEYPHFYITNIEALNAEQTASLRRKCFESDIKLVVVKNTLLAKALERVEKADADLVKVLEGSTSVMFAHTGKYSYAGYTIGMIANSTQPNKDLKPTMTGSYEVGLEMKFLNGRLGLDATYYNRADASKCVRLQKF